MGVGVPVPDRFLCQGPVRLPCREAGRGGGDLSFLPFCSPLACLPFLVQEKPREENDKEAAEEEKRTILAAGVRDGGEDDDRVRPTAAAAAASGNRNRNRCVSRSSVQVSLGDLSRVG